MMAVIFLNLLKNATYMSKIKNSKEASKPQWWYIKAKHAQVAHSQITVNER